jgi:branched-chain amino acid aminotransferase
VTAQFPDGEGIFETIKTVRGVPFALSRHLSRARRSASILGMWIPNEEEIRRQIAGVLSKAPSALEFGRLRVSFHVSGELELLHETYHPWSSYARITILDWLIQESSPLVGMKTLPFIENIECLKAARNEGFDEGIRLNSLGQVAEGATSNVLLKINDRWVTPNLASGALPGITRGLALEWLDIQESVITRSEFERTKSIYLLSSLKDLQPVSILGERLLEIDTRLRQEYVDRMAMDVDP